MTPAELTTWRSRMGWTAKKAAKQLGLNQNYYAAYERGYVNIYQRLADDLNINKRISRPIPRHVALACERLEQMKGAAVDKSGKVG